LKYLADTSALNRLARRQVDPAWEIVAARAQIAICEPVLRESMKIVRKREYEAHQADILETYDCLPVPVITWDYVRAMGSDLAKHSMHNMLDVTDFVVAALAIQLKLIVLHEDNDFIAAAKIFPQLEQKRISELPDSD
jgi:predicted nucleic acid-binding protein